MQNVPSLKTNIEKLEYALALLSEVACDYTPRGKTAEQLEEIGFKLGVLIEEKKRSTSRPTKNNSTGLYYETDKSQRINRAR